MPGGLERSQLGRRPFLVGLASAGAAAALTGMVGGGARAAAAPAERGPDLGPNVLILDPAMPRTLIQERLDAIFRQQERAHFTEARYAILLKPGRYALDCNVGFFTQVAGLGALPGM